MKIFKFIKRATREFKHGCYKYEWWRFKAPSLIIRAIFRVFQRSNNGIYITKEDWDNLIILDACTYELFAQTNWIKGKLEKKVSRGSHTWMFLKENFKGYYPDTVFVSANPFIWDFRNCFYQTIYIDSILPEILLEYVMEVDRVYHDKRLIVHFIQPHDPFIGKTQIEEAKKEDINPFYLFAKGKIKESILRQAYQDNLKRVLPVIEKLVNEFTGKTIITSDHGEAFGARVPFFPVRIYGHSGPRIKELVEVPWLTIEKFPRKRITRKGDKKKPIIIYENEIRKHLQVLEDV